MIFWIYNQMEKWLKLYKEMQLFINLFQHFPTGDYGDLTSTGADKPFRIRGYRDDSGKIIDFDDPTTWPTIKTQVKGV